MDNKSFADALDAVYGKTDQSESELNQSFFEALESVYPSIDAAPAVAPKIVEEELAYPPQLTSPGIVPPKNRIIPTDTTLPFPIPELPGPKPRPSQPFLNPYLLTLHQGLFSSRLNSLSKRNPKY